MADANDLARALGKLVPETPQRSRLPAAPDRPAIAAAIGVGDAAAADGIAFPLAETGRSLGTIHTLSSPSGLFTLEYQQATQIIMSDGNGESGAFNYADIG